MKYRLEWKYKVKNIPAIPCETQWLVGDHAIIFGEELEKSGKGLDLTFYDELGTDWTLKQLKKLLAETVEQPSDIIVYFDGGFNKEKNEAGLGVVIFFSQGNQKYRVRANERFEQMETNNEAEYAAFYFALNLLEEMDIRHQPCEFRGDSQVVLKQLEGDWPCFEEALNSWLDRIEEKLKKLSIQPILTAISRNDNKEADKLATQALEGTIVHSKMQIM